MVQITVWKCQATGSLFEKKKLFLVHKCRRAFERTVARRNFDYLNGLSDRVAVMRTLTSFAEIEDWINNNGKALHEHAREKIPGWRLRHSKNKDKYSLTDVKLRKMQWRVISGTHSAPIGRKTSGWRHGEKADQFSGWRGEIEFTQKGFEGFCSEIFKGTGINTESGGGGETVSFGVVLFAEDFPMLFNMMKQEGKLDPAIPYPLPVQPLPVPVGA